MALVFAEKKKSLEAGHQARPTLFGTTVSEMSRAKRWIDRLAKNIYTEISFNALPRYTVLAYIRRIPTWIRSLEETLSLA
jgi:hypothetical protein